MESCPVGEGRSSRERQAKERRLWLAVGRHDRPRQVDDPCTAKLSQKTFDRRRRDARPNGKRLHVEMGRHGKAADDLVPAHMRERVRVIQQRVDSRRRRPSAEELGEGRDDCLARRC